MTFQDRRQRVGIVGSGQMGVGIAEVCARAGLDVIAVDRDETITRHAARKLDRSLQRAVGAGKLDAADASAAREQVTFETELAVLADRDIVIEAASEDLETKVRLFGELDQIVSSRQALLASNTSSIPIMKLAMATSRPEHVIGIHFFNPVPVLGLVELVTTLLTADEVSEQARRFAEEQLDKRVIHSQDRAGFIVNALLIPYVLSAIRMLESGFASRDDIDRGMVIGCAHPIGPLALADLIGLDTVAAVAESLYDEFRDRVASPPPLLARMVDAGLLGRKSGRGFYDYSAGGQA